jgi:GH25 family lysozyme M1 (1,4-beta-N-acetylmuramidase)
MVDINMRVIDLFHGDRVSSFKKAAENGIWGVIHKATTGATGSDPAYAKRRQPAREAGLLWGAYHWGTKADVADQIENFLDHATPDKDTLVALDFEPSGNNTMSLGQARQFMKLIAEKLGRKPVIYSGHLIKEKLGNRDDEFFGSHRLWLAQYSPNPKVQKSWSKFWLWQYTDSTKGMSPNTAPGIPGDAKGNLDCNSYEGTRDQLRSQWAK